jgi:hypothetical protein
MGEWVSKIIQKFGGLKLIICVNFRTTQALLRQLLRAQGRVYPNGDGKLNYFLGAKT